MFCVKCGSQLKDGARFCTKCGSPVEAASVPRPTASAPAQQPRQRRPFPVWIVVVVLVLGAVGAAAGILLPKFFAGPSLKTVQADMLEFVTSGSFPTLQDVTEVTVEILDKDVSDSKRNADVSCSVAFETDAARFLWYYDLDYHKSSRDGWKVENYYPADTDDWEGVPLTTPSDETILEGLWFKDVEVDGNYFFLDDSNVSDVSVISHDADLEAGTDTVQLTYRISSDVAYYTVQAEATMKFFPQGIFDWGLTDLENTGEFTLSFQEGREFDPEDEAILTPLADYAVERLDAAPDAFAELSTDDISYSWYNERVTVNKSIQVESLAANREYDVEATYYYDDGWQFSGAEYSMLSVEFSPLLGSWVGHYPESDTDTVKPSITLKFTETENNELTATIVFGPSEVTPGFASGRESMVGWIDAYSDIVFLCLDQPSWIENPEDLDFFPVEYLDAEIGPSDEEISAYVDAGNGHYYYMTFTRAED